MQTMKLKQFKKAQAAIEYLLLLGVLTIVALAGFKTLIPSTQENAELFFNATGEQVMGDLAGSRLRETPNDIYP